MAKHQIFIILIYFVLANTYYLTAFFITYRRDFDHTNRTQQTVSLIAGVINFLIEVAWGVAFLLLWKFMSDLIRGHGITSKQRCLGNFFISLIMFCYFCACFIFEFLDPVLTYRFQDHKATIDWVILFYQFYYIRFFFDFISCMLILLLLYKFGPSSNAAFKAKRTSTQVSFGGYGQVSTANSGSYTEVNPLS